MSFLSSIECCDKKSCSCYTSSSAGGVDMARRSQAYIALESIEQQMTTLAEMIEDNKAKQEEIKSLRDGVSIRPASSWNTSNWPIVLVIQRISCPRSTDNRRAGTDHAWPRTKYLGSDINLHTFLASKFCYLHIWHAIDLTGVYDTWYVCCRDGYHMWLDLLRGHRIRVLSLVEEATKAKTQRSWKKYGYEPSWRIEGIEGIFAPATLNEELIKHSTVDNAEMPTWKLCQPYKFIKLKTKRSKYKIEKCKNFNNSLIIITQGRATLTRVARE